MAALGYDPHSVLAVLEVQGQWHEDVEVNFVHYSRQYVLFRTWPMFCSSLSGNLPSYLPSCLALTFIQGCLLLQEC